MSLFNLPNLTPEQQAEKIKLMLDANAFATLRNMKNDLKEAFNYFWNPPGQVRTQMICDSFGINARKLFEVNTATVVFIMTLDPTYIPPMPGVYKINNDGTVIIGPYFESVTGNIFKIVGEEINLSVTTSGVGPITYQWKKDDVAIDGATNSTLTIQSCTLQDAGIYKCEATNEAGTVSSKNINVVVTEE